jgi:Uma2 family endonuclease
VGEGFFHPEERLELIAGELLQKMTPQGSLHSTGIRSVEEVLRPIFFNKGFDIRIQMPVALSDDSEPEPDVAVVPGSLHDYRDAHPTTAVLIVEVADSTVEFDRQSKAPLYARAGIADYWIVNLVDHWLEVYRHPTSVDTQTARYTTILRLSPTDTIAPLAAPQTPVRVSDLLP